VLVPFQDHINRLIAARLQFDIMGVSTLLLARTDSESGKLISSNIDPRDHEFLLGVVDVKANNVKSQAQVLYELETSGASSEEINAAEVEWTESHPLVTFAEAVKQKVGSDPKYKEFSTAIHGKSQSEAEALAKKTFSQEFDWSPEVCRTKEGHYQYAAGIEPAISRVLAFAPYADMLWLETKIPDLKQAQTFAARIREKFPNKYLVYNLSPSFNWDAAGYSDADLKAFCWELAKSGFVLQTVSVSGLHQAAVVSCELSRRYKEDGMLAYVDLIQRRERKVGTDVLTHQKWSGANYMDAIFQMVQAGNSHTSSVGKDSTEHNF
jgi:isocitrate lyase